MMDKIFIKALRIEALIGIYPHEKITKQLLLVDLELFVDIALPAKTGKISDAVDYDLVADSITEFVQQSKYDLVEQLIVRITDVILKEFKVNKVRCTVYKPQAINSAETVGLTIERSK